MDGKTYLQRVQEAVLDQMIDEEIIIQNMKQQGIKVDPGGSSERIWISIRKA